MPQYTRQDIRDRARRLIAQVSSSNSVFTDGELNDFIDDWLIDMAAWLEYPRAEATFDGGSVAEQLSYPIDKTAVLKILAVYRDSQELNLVTEEWMRSYDSKWRDRNSGTPTYAFLIDNDVLALFPKDSTAGKTILIRYVRIPTLPTADTDTFDLPVPLQATGQFYVASMAEISRQAIDRAAYFMKVYTGMRQAVRSQSTAQMKRGGWEFHEDR